MNGRSLTRHGANLKVPSPSDCIGIFQFTLKTMESNRNARFPPLHLVSPAAFSSICLEFDRKAQKAADNIRGRLGDCARESFIIQTILQAAKDRGWNHYRQNSSRSVHNPWNANNGVPRQEEYIRCSCCLEDVTVGEAIVCMATTPHVS